MRAKAKPAILLSVTVVVTILIGVLALTGMKVGLYDLKPWYSVIQQGLDLAGGMSAVYDAKETEGMTDADIATKLNNTISVIRKRLDAKGYTEATVTKQGSTRIRVEIPGVSDEAAVLELLSKPSKLEFKDADGNVLMEGQDVKSATAGYQSASEVVVYFQLTDEGSKKFAEATKNNMGKTISIVVDGETVSAPKVNSVISNGAGIIEGDFTYEQAQNLAIAIESGALPLNMEQTEMRTVSASLGQNVLYYSLIAGIIGIALVMLYMIIMYRLPGVVSSFALVTYLIMLLFMLATVNGVQLTLPGIAGIVLSIGMAVDANIIVFERFREEIRSGKSLYSACEIGFSKALSAILDGNITTVIAALVLYFLGTGSVKGFAVTLLLGTLVSMVSSLVVSRFLLRQVIKMCGEKQTLFIGKRARAQQEA
nr:protein translocase subunit SecD [bacterium]